MRNRHALCALCLCVLLAAPLGAQAAYPDDTTLLSALLPGETLTALPDFYYATGPISEYSHDKGVIHKLREVKQMGNMLVLVMESHGMAHVEGYRNYTFAVYNPQTNALYGDALMFSADDAAYYLAYRDGELSVLYTGSTTYQGYEACSGGRWAWNQGEWKLAWPADMEAFSDTYSAFWENRKGVISAEFPGNMILYDRVRGIGNNAGTQWEYYGEMNTF